MKPRLEAPQEPVIPNNECNAALRLMMHIGDNLVERGDMPENAWELVSQFTESARKLHKHPTGKDANALYAAIETGMLPTFHHGSSQEEATTALHRLIAATD